MEKTFKICICLIEELGKGLGVIAVFDVYFSLSHNVIDMENFRSNQF